MPVPIWLVLASALLTFGLAVFFTKPHEHEGANVLALPSSPVAWLAALIFTGVLSVIAAIFVTIAVFAVAPGWLSFAAQLVCTSGIGGQVPPGPSGIMLLPEFRCVEAGVPRDITVQTFTVGAQTFFFGLVLPIFYFVTQHVERNH